MTDGGGTSTVRSAPGGYRLGVDLGTTYTAVAVERDGRPEIFTLGSRSASIPSVIFLRDDGLFLAGDAAIRRAVSEPNRVAREFKRRVGDPTPILLAGTPHSPESLMARLLSAVLGAVAEREGAFPERVAVTHPANWGPYKLDLLDRMADIADPGRRGPLHRLHTVSEPEAAALSYASTERVDPGEVVAVYDLGGGTFDAAVLSKTEAGFELLGPPQGIERLGGIDFDEAVFSFVIRALDADRSVSVLESLDPDDPATQSAVARLRQECTEAKEALSSDTEVSIPVVLPGLHTQVRLTRAELEAMIRPAIEQTIDALRRAVELAGVDVEGLKAVLLVGGSSRIPLVAEMVASELGRPVALDVHPKNAVALGAALLARAQPLGNGSAPESDGSEPLASAPTTTAPPATGPPAPAPEHGELAPPPPAPGKATAEQSMAEWLSDAHDAKSDPLAPWGELPPEPPPPPPPPPPHRWSRPVGPPAAPARRRAVVIAVALVLAVGLVAAVVAWSRSDAPTPSPAVYAFSPATLDNGLVVSRTWQLIGEHGDRLRGAVVLRNPTTAPVSGSYDEVIPKSVAATVGQIRFDPVYSSVVQEDPIVRYDLADFEAGGRRDLRYEVDVPPEGNSLGRLARLAADQIEAETGRPRVQGEVVQEMVTLQDLGVSPDRVDLLPGASFTLGVSGTMSDGTPAPPEILAGVAWSSSNTRVVTVAAGLLRATSIGAATVLAQAGGIERRVTVSVIPPDVSTTARRRTSRPERTASLEPSGGAPPVLTLPPATPTTKPPKTPKPPRPTTATVTTTPPTTGAPPSTNTSATTTPTTAVPPTTASTEPTTPPTTTEAPPT